MYCIKCGKENREGANFCQACGQPFGPNQSPGYSGAGYYYSPYQAPYPGYQYGSPTQFVEHKDTVVALLLALMLPGAGHMYAGEVKKGIIILAFFFIIGFVSAMAFFGAFWSLGGSGGPVDFVLVVIIILVATAIFWLYQIYDAYQAALRFNTAHGLKRYY